MKENAFTEHYGKHGIAPSKQDLSDLEKVFFKRKMLYTKLGIPPMFIKDKEILEVGPGAGINPLVLKSLQPKKLVLIEPNQAAVEDINESFERYDNSNITEVHNIFLEDYQKEKVFDLVICEGLIPGLSEKIDFLSLIDQYVKQGGILAITCRDEVSSLFEVLRLYLGQKLTDGIQDVDKKLDVLESAFEKHLATIDGFGRTVRDWCFDNLLGEAHFNYDFSVKDCISYFNQQYYFYNLSPDIFADYRWYKKTPSQTEEHNAIYLSQFTKRHHNLMHYQIVSEDRTEAQNNVMLHICKNIAQIIKESVKNYNDQEKLLIKELKLLQNNLIELEGNLQYAIQEVIDVISQQLYTTASISDEMPNFMYAFGQGQQYISLIKK